MWASLGGTNAEWILKCVLGAPRAAFHGLWRLFPEVVLSSNQPAAPLTQKAECVRALGNRFADVEKMRNAAGSKSLR